MKPFAASLMNPGLLNRFAHPLFCAVWIALTMVYACLAVDAYHSMHPSLPRSGFRIPPGRNVQIGNLRFQEVINGLAEKYDQTAMEFEGSLRRSGRTVFTLNLTSALLSLVGFTAQWLSGLKREQSFVGTTRRRRRQLAMASVPIEFDDSATAFTEAIPLHEGSFPDAGYGR